MPGTRAQRPEVMFVLLLTVVAVVAGSAVQGAGAEVEAADSARPACREAIGAAVHPRVACRACGCPP